MRNKRPDLQRLNEKNGFWKGDAVGYQALHSWVRRRLNKPYVCPSCGDKDRKIHLANKSGNYLRDLSDWMWLCSMCHWHYDRGGRVYAKMSEV